MMKTILITGDPGIAADCEAAGVSRIMVDLETIGKKERQASRTTLISKHTKEDIQAIRAVLKAAELIVRINPYHAGSESEIDHAIRHGADIIMLPMINDMAELDACIAVIAGRASLLPLVETAYSMQHIKDIAAREAIHEIYIGLNDLHLSLGLEFLFEPLALGYLDTMAAAIRASGKPFGFGGIAKMGSGELPAGRILAEHQRLGSSRVILSSRFCSDVNIGEPQGRQARIKEALALMQETYATLNKRSKNEQEQDFLETCAIIRRIAGELKLKRQTS